MGDTPEFRSPGEWWPWVLLAIGCVAALWMLWGPGVATTTGRSDKEVSARTSTDDSPAGAWVDQGMSLEVEPSVLNALETGAREALVRMWGERRVTLAVETMSCRVIESGTGIVSFLNESSGRVDGYRAVCSYTVDPVARDLRLTIDAVVLPGAERHEAGVATEVDHVMSVGWVEGYAEQRQLAGEVRCDGTTGWFIIAPGGRHRCSIGSVPVVLSVEMEHDTPRGRFSITTAD